MVSQGEEYFMFTSCFIVDEIISIHYPKITGDFTGTGDIFAAVLLGWFNHGLKVTESFIKS